MSPSIVQSGNDVIIKAKIKPNSPCFSVYFKEDRIIIEVSSHPEKGKANQEIVKKLSKLFGTGVEIMRGSLSKEKTIVVRDMNKEEIKKVIIRK